LDGDSTSRKPAGKSAFVLVWKRSSFIVNFYLSFILISTVVFLAALSKSPIIPLLVNSRATRWGIVTSLVVHWPLAHFVENMVGIAALLFILPMLMNVDEPRDLRRAMLYFTLAPLGSAVVANALVLVYEPDLVSYGASGLFYAALGATLTYALYGIISRVARSGLPLKRKDRKFIGFNLLVCVPFIVLTVISPRIFIGVGPGVNFLVHFLAFVFGAFSAMAYFFVFWFPGVFAEVVYRMKHDGLNRSDV
jgi:membrane associated rhomboid family serine protease